jgi:hypothetical protein
MSERIGVVKGEKLEAEVFAMYSRRAGYRAAVHERRLLVDGLEVTAYVVVVEGDFSSVVRTMASGDSTSGSPGTGQGE